MTTTNKSVTDTPNGQLKDAGYPLLKNGGLDTAVNIVDDYREMFNNAIAHSIRHHDAVEEGQQSLAKLKLMGEEFTDAGITNVHQMFVGPKIAHKVQLEDGTYILLEAGDNIKLEQAVGTVFSGRPIPN